MIWSLRVDAQRSTNAMSDRRSPQPSRSGDDSPRAHGRAVVLALAAALAWPALAAAQEAVAQVPPSAAGQLFVPGSRVPLSEFRRKTTGTVVLHVEPGILAWIAAQSGKLQVAVRTATGVVEYLPASAVDVAAGTVTLTWPAFGTCVAVSNLLKHDLPVVTHWNASLNGGRGGQQTGARDALLPLGLDPATSTLEVDGHYLNTNADPLQSSYWGDDDPAVGAYYFASDRYALFSDGTGAHDDAALPGFERYIGETFTTLGPTSLAAIWLSDKVRAMTGFPVAHKNHPLAFDAAAPAASRVLDGAPLFQAVHGWLVDITLPTGTDLYPATAGSENSLGTFLLPPGWTSQAADDTYPILFNGFYDLHASTFGSVGLGFFEVLGALLQHPAGPRRAVGVLWNGGGADACYTMHRSAYDGAARLIADAALELAADPDRIVMSGGSRGGGTALEMSSNPYGAGYTVQFVNATAAQVKPGQVITFVSPSYSLGMGSMQRVTGYQQAWMSGWIDPDSGRTGKLLTMQNLFGTDDAAVIDADHALDSGTFRNGLLAAGARVLLHLGTHDYSLPLAQAVTYANHLRADGVPLHLQVFYRFGHTSPADTVAENTAFMHQVFEGSTAFDPVTEHFARDPLDHTAALPIDPDHVPLVYETPITIGSGQAHTWSFVGQPGGRFEVRAAHLEPGWASCGTPVFTAPLAPVLSGTLPLVSGDEFGAISYELSLPVQTGYWWYEVRYSPDGDTNWEVTLGPGDIAPPTLLSCEEPVVLVTPSEVLGVGDEARTGGLAEDGVILQGGP
jgi:hypothetical protein